MKATQVNARRSVIRRRGSGVSTALSCRRRTSRISGIFQIFWIFRIIRIGRLPLNCRSLQMFPACVLVAGSLAGPLVSRVEGAEPLQPARAGALLITAGADTAAGFRWLELPAIQRRCLVWADGFMTLPSDVTPEHFGQASLLVPYGPNLAGISDGRHLRFVLGKYRVERPLLLTDGVVSLYVSYGELNIEDGRIVYQAVRRISNPKAQYLLLAGIVILITMLLLRIRSRLRRS